MSLLYDTEGAAVDPSIQFSCSGIGSLYLVWVIRIRNTIMHKRMLARIMMYESTCLSFLISVTFDHLA